SLVRKVADELLEYGQYQRSLLCYESRGIDAGVAEQQENKTSQSIQLKRPLASNAAEEAGILQADITIHITQQRPNSVSELQEYVARHRPGKEIKVTYLRNGEERVTRSRLRSFTGAAEAQARAINYIIEGATFEDLPVDELNELGIEGGVRITDLSP